MLKNRVPPPVGVFHARYFPLYPSIILAGFRRLYKTDDSSPRFSIPNPTCDSPHPPQRPPISSSPSRPPCSANLSSMHETAVTTVPSATTGASRSKSRSRACGGAATNCANASWGSRLTHCGCVVCANTAVAGTTEMEETERATGLGKIRTAGMPKEATTMEFTTGEDMEAGKTTTAGTTMGVLTEQNMADPKKFQGFAQASSPPTNSLPQAQEIK
ncbi:hypothetical protein B0H17DRAFT_1103376 [Mycena rosella]|uniref:Uncharacterized protein n=1 Tax=Mycena rosella TaxID=1033263 RepID=A0AAD7CH25_MYCRO|nr:hypothetical protein B0H17DRAFT_1103376 [Mycena rosella]